MRFRSLPDSYRSWEIALRFSQTGQSEEALLLSLFQRDGARKQDVVLQVNVHMQVRLHCLQAIEKRADGAAGVGRILKAASELTDLQERPASAFMLTFHHPDGVGDGPEGNRWQRPARGFGAAVLREEGEEHEFFQIGR